MISGSHIHPDKYLGDAWRTVHRPRADCPRGRFLQSYPLKEISPRDLMNGKKGELEIGVYLDRLVAIPDV